MSTTVTSLRGEKLSMKRFNIDKFSSLFKRIFNDKLNKILKENKVIIQIRTRKTNDTK